MGVDMSAARIDVKMVSTIQTNSIIMNYKQIMLIYALFTFFSAAVTVTSIMGVDMSAARAGLKMVSTMQTSITSKINNKL